MAKRRRLEPLTGFGSEPGEPSAGGPSAGGPGQDAGPAGSGPIAPPGLMPIARVAGDAATRAALDEVTGVLWQARSEGRLIQKLPLAAIRADHLLRDRLAVDEAEMAPLLASLRARGQQTPVEVVALEGGDYGLISGWRRVLALRRLQAETGEERFATVLALQRQPRDAAEAYVAMVEENEIRLGLSHYERARIVLRSVEAGVFADAQRALRGLFASGSRARRSKIGSFITVVRALDGQLQFPAAMGERLGLRLAQRLDADPALAGVLAARLAKSAPATPEAEQALILEVLKTDAPRTAAPPAPAVEEPAPGVRLERSGSDRQPVLTLSGPGVDQAFAQRLRDWLVSGG